MGPINMCSSGFKELGPLVGRHSLSLPARLSLHRTPLAYNKTSLEASGPSKGREAQPFLALPCRLLTEHRPAPYPGGACRQGGGGRGGGSPWPWRWPQSHNHRASLCSVHAHFPPLPTQPEGLPFHLRLYSLILLYRGLQGWCHSSCLVAHHRWADM